MTQKVRCGQSNTRGGELYRRKPRPRVDENFRDFAHGWPQQSNPLQGRRNIVPPSPNFYQYRKKTNIDIIISSQEDLAHLIVFRN